MSAVIICIAGAKAAGRDEGHTRAQPYAGGTAQIKFTEHKGQGAFTLSAICAEDFALVRAAGILGSLETETRRTPDRLPVPHSQSATPFLSRGVIPAGSSPDRRIAGGLLPIWRGLRLFQFVRAIQVARHLVEKETRGWGDQGNALERLERRYGLPFWSLNNLRTGRAKTIEASLFARIRTAYLDLCEREVAKLQHEIAIEKALTPDDTFEDLEREAAQLVARVQAKKAALK